MIVTCDQCQSRFKVPDEKVGEKGVRVRCSKCQHAFRVMRDNPAPLTSNAEAAASWDVPNASNQMSADPPTRPGVRISEELARLDALGKLEEAQRMPGGAGSAAAQEVSASPQWNDSSSHDPFPGHSAVDHAFREALNDIPPIDPMVPPEEMPLSRPNFSAPNASHLTISPSTSAEVSLAMPEPALAPVLEAAPLTTMTLPKTRRAGSFVLNFVLAALLFLILLVVTVQAREGHLDWSGFRWQTLGELWAAPKPFVATDVSNGLYPTRTGKSVFFIRGDAVNRSKRVARVRVHADILDGDQRVQSAESMAGVSPTPEDLYDLTNPSDATALISKLNAGAMEIAPGARAPFLIMFFEYPADLAQYRLKVELTPEHFAPSIGP